MSSAAYAKPPSTANTPVSIVPIAPHTPWTPIAPTGSSIFNFWSINSIATTTAIPATIPIIQAPTGFTTAQPAVIATRPASEPFSVIETSGFLYFTQVNIIVVTVAAAAAIFVVTNTLPASIILSSPVIETVEHPLNPNQQNHNINTPRAPTVMLWPGGQPMQAYQMYKDDIKISHSTLVLFVEFIFFQTVTIMYAIIGFATQYSLLNGKINSLMILFILGIVFNFAVLVAFILVLFHSEKVKKLLNIVVRFLKFCKFKKADMIKEKVDSIIDDYKECAMYIVKNKGIMFKTFITKCVQIFAIHSVPYWIYRSFGFNEYSIFMFVGVQAVLFISVSALPLPGSVGASESGFLILFKLLFPASVLNEAMLLSRGVSFYLFVFLCGIFILVKYASELHFISVASIIWT